MHFAGLIFELTNLHNYIFPPPQIPKIDPEWITEVKNKTFKTDRVLDFRLEGGRDNKELDLKRSTFSSWVATFAYNANLSA